MSRQYAKAAVAAMKADVIIRTWATGGILDRDPRRSGPNATDSAFETTPDGDIKPVIAAVATGSVRPFTRISRATEDSVEIRIFTPDYAENYDGLDMVASRIKRLLTGYRANNGTPGIFQFETRLGIQNGGAFEGVAYDEVRFVVLSIDEPLEVA